MTGERSVAQIKKIKKKFDQNDDQRINDHHQLMKTSKQFVLTQKKNIRDDQRSVSVVS